MRKFFITSLAFLLFQSVMKAQSTFGLSLDAFVPTGELRQDSPEIWGGGFGLEVAVQLNNSPIHVGGQLNFLRYGSEVRDGWHGPGLGYARVRRNNEVFNTLGFVRVKPEVKGRIQPFLDFLTGFSYVYTRATFRDSAIQEPFGRNRDLGDISFNYGIGGGFEIFLDDEISLDVRVKNLRGTKTDYLTARSVNFDNELEGYDINVRNSQFSFMSFSMGIKVLID